MIHGKHFTVASVIKLRLLRNLSLLDEVIHSTPTVTSMNAILVILWYTNDLHSQMYIYWYLCPQFRRSWLGILVSGCPCVRACVRASRTVHARVFKFNIWIPHGKIADTRLFLGRDLPFWSYASLKKSEWNLMHAISYEPCMLVFKISNMDSSWKIADLYFFSCPSYLPFWSYAHLKKLERNIVRKISRKRFGLGTWNLVSW